jgi:acetyl esterase/lipase
MWPALTWHTAARLVVAVHVTAVPRGAVLAQQDTTVNTLGIERPGMAAVRVERGLVYRAPLTMNVYRSPTQRPGERRPALVLVHGGLVAGVPGAAATDWAFYQSWGRLAAVSGLVGVTFNHRLTTNDNIAEAESDVRAAIAYARANAERLGIDPDRLCVAFYSAGGAVAGAVLRAPEPYVRCVMLFYTYLDLEHLRIKTPFREPYPAAHVDSLISRYSPAALVTVDPARLPPLYLAMAGRDAIPGLNASIVRFMRAALASNARLDFALHPTGEHGFDARNHDERTTEILENALAFIRRHLIG